MKFPEPDAFSMQHNEQNPVSALFLKLKQNELPTTERMAQGLASRRNQNGISKSDTASQSAIAIVTNRNS